MPEKRRTGELAAAASFVDLPTVGVVLALLVDARVRRTLADNLQKNLEDKRIDEDTYMQGVHTIAESNPEIAQKKASNFA